MPKPANALPNLNDMKDKLTSLAHYAMFGECLKEAITEEKIEERVNFIMDKLSIAQQRKVENGKVLVEVVSNDELKAAEKNRIKAHFTQTNTVLADLIARLDKIIAKQTEKTNALENDGKKSKKLAKIQMRAALKTLKAISDAVKNNHIMPSMAHAFDNVRYELCQYPKLVEESKKLTEFKVVDAPMEALKEFYTQASVLEFEIKAPGDKNTQQVRETTQLINKLKKSVKPYHEVGGAAEHDHLKAYENMLFFMNAHLNNTVKHNATKGEVLNFCSKRLDNPLVHTRYQERCIAERFNYFAYKVIRGCNELKDTWSKKSADDRIYHIFGERQNAFNVNNGYKNNAGTPWQLPKPLLPAIQNLQFEIRVGLCSHHEGMERLTEILKDALGGIQNDNQRAGRKGSQYAGVLSDCLKKILKDIELEPQFTESKALDDVVEGLLKQYKRRLNTLASSARTLFDKHADTNTKQMGKVKLELEKLKVTIPPINENHTNAPAKVKENYQKTLGLWVEFYILLRTAQIELDAKYVDNIKPSYCGTGGPWSPLETGLKAIKKRCAINPELKALIKPEANHLNALAKGQERLRNQPAAYVEPEEKLNAIERVNGRN